MSYWDRYECNGAVHLCLSAIKSANPLWLSPQVFGMFSEFVKREEHGDDSVSERAAIACRRLSQDHMAQLGVLSVGSLCPGLPCQEKVHKNLGLASLRTSTKSCVGVGGNPVLHFLAGKVTSRFSSIFLQSVNCSTGGGRGRRRGRGRERERERQRDRERGRRREG